MKKRLILFLSLLVTVTLLVAGMTISASAAGEVATIAGKGSYTTLAAAVSAADDGDVIDVIADTTVSTAIVVTKQITVTSSNSSTIACSVSNAFTVGVKSGTSGNLTFAGNVRVTNTTVQTVQMCRGKFTLKDNAYISGTFDVVNAGGSGTPNDVEVNIEGGTATASDTQTGTSRKGVLFASTDGAKMNIKGGSIVPMTGATVSAVRFASKNGELNISGGLVSAASNTLNLYGDNALTVNISGGTVETTGSGNWTVYIAGKNKTVNVSGTANVTSATNKTVYIAKVTNTTVNISGGTVSSASGDTVFADTGSTGSVTVSGGKIETKSGQTCFNFSCGGTNHITFTMTGGEIAAASGRAIYAPNKDTVTFNISGGKISGGSKVMHIEGSNTVVTISGTAQIVSSGQTAIYCNNASSGVTLNIQGGTISATTAAVMYDGSAMGTVNISGGLVKTTSGNQCLYFNQTGKVTLTMTGGELASKAENAIFICKANSVDATLSGGKISGTMNVVRVNAPGNTVTISGTVAITATTKAAVSANNNVGDFTVSIQGGTITAPTQTILWQGTSTGLVNISGGTITATGDFTIEAAAGTFNISGGTFTSGGYGFYLKGTPAFNVTGGIITAGKNAVFAISNVSETTPAVLNVSDGTMILGGNGNGNKIVGDVLSAGSNCDVTVSGGLFINNNTGNHSVFDSCVSLAGGKILYRNNVDFVVANQISASKTAKIAYDLNGNGLLDDGETFYFFTLFRGADESLAGVMQKGASVRLATGTNGLRFTTDFSADVVSALSGLGDVTYGTIILPTEFLANLDAFTKAALDAASVSYLDIPAVDGLIDNGDGSFTVRAVITNILTANYDRAFSAVAYAKVGETYYYTAYNTADNSRTVEEIALAALDDLSDTQTGEYINAVSVYGVDVYSPYTTAQRTVLQGYITAALNVPVLAGSDGLYRSGENTYQYYNTNATVADYTNYQSALVSAGYTEFSEKTVDNNKFSTYTKGDSIVTVSYTGNTTTLRVLMESAEDTALPTTAAQNTGYATGTAATVTQLGLWDNDETESHETSEYRSGTFDYSKKTFDYATTNYAGMCYIIRLSDGSFVIIDGGYGTETHRDNFYYVLKKQAGSENFTIAAWILTHTHNDHTDLLSAFVSKYGSKATIERIIYNFPSNKAVALTAPSLMNTKALQAISKTGAKVTIAHAGQEFFIRNAKINILFASELMEPHSYEYANSASLVFNVELEGKTILFLGDAGGQESKGGSSIRYVDSIYSATTLKSDFVQATHHGIDKAKDPDEWSLNGFYENKVQASYVFFPIGSEHVKVGDQWANLDIRNPYLYSKTHYVAGKNVTVVTLTGGVSAVTQTITEYLA